MVRLLGRGWVISICKQTQANLPFKRRRVFWSTLTIGPIGFRSSARESWSQNSHGSLRTLTHSSILVIEVEYESKKGVYFCITKLRPFTCQGLLVINKQPILRVGKSDHNPIITSINTINMPLDKVPVLFGLMYNSREGDRIPHIFPIAEK